MQKGAQITVFIILGILIIAIFGFMFYITQEVSRIKLETEANRIVDSILATTPLNYYVTLCLEEATKRAINISGRQGGPLYPEDYTVGVPDVMYDSDKVSYAVVHVPGINPYFQYENQYPCFGTENYSAVPPAFCGFVNNATLFPFSENIVFGRRYMKLLCREGTCSQDSLNITVGGKQLDFYPIAGNYSIQESLERYTANQTENCSKQISNISAFQAFNVTAGNISVNITFGYNGVEVVADYPLIIKIQDVEPVIRILKFNYFSPVRFKSVYKFARHLAEEDNIDLNFDISSNWTKDQYVLNDFAVNLERVGKDTLVKISDNDRLHYLKNGPFVFQFAVQNRPPVLDYIKQYDRYDFFLEKYQLPESQQFDYIVAEGDTIKISPNAKDPDGDALSYNYSGWKENYDEIFDETAGADCRAVPTNCITRDNSKTPHNWTNSSEYQLTNISANYKTNHTDIGPHNITVCAYETGNPASMDCQTIRILVDDVFIVIANITKCYDDISNKSLVSIEDPICLQGDVIDYFNPGITTYLWKIYPSPTIYYGTEDFVVLPKDYTIDGIAEYTPGKINYPNLVIDTLKTFVVGVQRGATVGTDNATAVVRKCLPHRTAGKTAPYPFNNILGDNYVHVSDPFYANHTCCIGNPSDSSQLWNFAPVGTVCYNYTQYGLWNASFRNIKQQAEALMQGTLQTTIVTFPYIKKGVNTAEPQDPDLLNDVIKKSFISHCSGNSGNTCNSSVIELYENVTPCPDLTGTQTARCQWAPLNAQTSKPGCINLLGTTFEKVTGARSDNLCDIPKCTDASRIGKNSGYADQTDVENAYFLCNATCYNGNCQKPVNCTNCRGSSYASTKSGGNINYTLKQSFNYQVGSCASDNCAVLLDQSKEDVCRDAQTLTEYYAAPDPTAQPLPYLNETKNCADADLNLETEATISMIAGVETCTPGNISSCSDGACFSSQQTLAIHGSCSALLYTGVEATDTNGNGIQESCKFSNQVSYKFSQIACETCHPGYIWSPPNNCNPP